MGDQAWGNGQSWASPGSTLWRMENGMDADPATQALGTPSYGSGTNYGAAQPNQYGYSSMVGNQYNQPQGQANGNNYSVPTPNQSSYNDPTSMYGDSAGAMSYINAANQGQLGTSNAASAPYDRSKPGYIWRDGSMHNLPDPSDKLQSAGYYQSNPAAAANLAPIGGMTPQVNGQGQYLNAAGEALRPGLRVDPNELFAQLLRQRGLPAGGSLNPDIVAQIQQAQQDAWNMATDGKTPSWAGPGPDYYTAAAQAGMPLNAAQQQAAQGYQAQVKAGPGAPPASAYQGVMQGSGNQGYPQSMQAPQAQSQPSMTDWFNSVIQQLYGGNPLSMLGGGGGFGPLAGNGGMDMNSMMQSLNMLHSLMGSYGNTPFGNNFNSMMTDTGGTNPIIRALMQPNPLFFQQNAPSNAGLYYSLMP